MEILGSPKDHVDDTAKPEEQLVTDLRGENLGGSSGAKSDRNRGRAGTRKKKLDPAEIFDGLVEKFKDKKSVSYNMSGSFNDKDVIEHKVFGKGFITSLPTSQQIEVAFLDGTRILACNR